MMSTWRQTSEQTGTHVNVDFLAIEDEFGDSGIQDSNDEVKQLLTILCTNSDD